MVTKQYTYQKAFENKKNALARRQNERSMMMAAAYSSNTQLDEIDTTLRMLGSQLAMSAFSADKATLDGIKSRMQALTQQKKEILKKAGVPDEGYDCELCRDTGYVNGKICECIKKEAAKIMANELSREMPLSDCRFENFDLKFYSDKTDEEGNNPRRRMTAILKLCREYVINFGPNSPNLLFSGNAGLGKTHLTMAIVSGVIEKGFLPVYGSAENLFSAVETEKFSGEGRGNYETMLNCDLLVIDDLGAEMATAFTKSVLYNLVNTRLLSNRPTIINTNLSMREIEQRYSARVASRLIGHYNPNRFLGADIRQQKLLKK